MRSVNWIGDAILTTPSIRALRRAFPDARLDVVCRPWVAPVFETSPDVDRVVRIDDKASRAAFLGACARIRRERYDLGVAFPNSFGAAFQLWAGGARRRIGYARDGRGWLLTEAIPVTGDILAVHQVEYYLNLLRDLLDVDAAERRLILSATDGDRARVETVLREQGVSPDTPLIGLNPGATYGTAKRWLPERFAALADRAAERGVGVVVTGSPAEAEGSRQIASRATTPLIDLAGRISLSELFALMERLRCYVTNDSGAMHVAAAMGCPVVAVFGPTDWRTTAPYADDAILVRHDTPCAPCLLRECPTDHACMRRITVDEVWDALAAQLDK